MVEAVAAVVVAKAEVGVGGRGACPGPAQAEAGFPVAAAVAVVVVVGAAAAAVVVLAAGSGEVVQRLSPLMRVCGARHCAPSLTCQSARDGALSRAQRRLPLRGFKSAARCVMGARAVAGATSHERHPRPRGVAEC